MRRWRHGPRPLAPVHLGTVSCPGGLLVVLDPGYAGLWSAGEVPNPDRVRDPALRAALANRRDLRFVGPDAARLAGRFDWQSQSFGFVYDVPAERVQELQGQAEASARHGGLDARLIIEPAQIPHRQRAQRCGAGRWADPDRRGPWFAVSPPLPPERFPPERSFPLWGQPTDYGDTVGVRWSDLRVQLSDQPSAQERHLGHVLVDYATLLVADADALASWREDTTDGLADVLFWGRDAHAALDAVGGASLGDEFGWRDLPLAQAEQRARAVWDWKSAEPDRKLAIAWRPHSHRYQLLSQLDATAHQTGTLTLDETDLLALSTSVGDGAFEVRLQTDTADLTKPALTLCATGSSCPR